MGPVVCALAVSLSIASVPQPAGPITYNQVSINDSAGDQFDPHVDGDLAAYSESAATQQIRYYLFSSGVDTAISNVQPDGTIANDLLSDVQAGRIVFTRVGSDRNSIMLFNPAASPSLVEVSPKAGSNRFGVAIGGPSIAYVDLGLGAGGEIVHVDLANGDAETRLTFDGNIDQNIAVSPDGAVLVWERCEGTSLNNCDIHQAVRTGSAWANSAVTTTTGFNEESPDTNGTLVVYDSNRGAGSVGYDVFYRAVSGGAETPLQLSGDQLNPSISGGVIAFESGATGSANSDIFLYEIATNRLFQVTATAALNESLNDVTVLANGDVRLVWDANVEVVTRSVFGATFTIPTQSTCANRTVTLDASRSYSPTRATDGHATLSPAMMFVLPASIAVTAGNSGNKKVVLSITADHVTTHCQYRGGSNQAHPTSPVELARATRYVFEHCTGAGNRLSAGALVTADALVLHVQGGDNRAGTTRVHLSLAEACSGTSVFPPAGGGCGDDDDDGDDDGEDDDLGDRFGCSSTGGSMGPIALGLAALLFASRRRMPIRVQCAGGRRRLPM